MGATNALEMMRLVGIPVGARCCRCCVQREQRGATAGSYRSPAKAFSLSFYACAHL